MVKYMGIVVCLAIVSLSGCGRDKSVSVDPLTLTGTFKGEMLREYIFHDDLVRESLEVKFEFEDSSFSWSGKADETGYNGGFGVYRISGNTISFSDWNWCWTGKGTWHVAGLFQLSSDDDKVVMIYEKQSEPRFWLQIIIASTGR